MSRGQPIGSILRFNGAIGRVLLILSSVPTPVEGEVPAEGAVSAEGEKPAEGGEAPKAEENNSGQSA